MSKKALDRIRLVLSRRRMLQGTAALVSTAAASSCADDAVGGSGTDTDASSSTTAAESTASTSSTSGSTMATGDDTTSTGEPGSSSSSGGASSGESSESGSSSSSGESELTPEELLAPIEHIIVLCMENRSFDHYLGALSLVEGVAVDGLTGTESNPDQDGNDVVVFESDNFTPEDPPHGWSACHDQWNMGANDGFVLEHFESNGAAEANEVMGYHVRDHLPVYYALADAYTVCDRWFCGLLGPTWPNRYYLHCASSNGATSNAPPNPLPTSIQDACSDAGITNNNYYDGLAAWRWGAFPIVGFSGTAAIGEFFDKLANGGLEQVVIIDPDFLSNDDHPSHDISLGQAFVASVYEALAQSDYWESSLLIITYDEHGGFFDHVAPPTTEDSQGPEFAQMGFRVPAIVVGPYVRKGAVVSTQFEHSSFPKTVAVRFGLTPLNERADAAADLSSCIDPAYLDDPQEPAPLPPLDLDDDRILANAGQTTSQPELFGALGIEVPLRGDQLARQRESLKSMIARARRLGVARPKAR